MVDISVLIKSNLNMMVVGFGCCKQEILATQGPLYDIQRYGVNFVDTAEDADVLVIQGFFNEIGITRIIDIYNNMLPPKSIIAVGSCILNENIFNLEEKLLKKFRRKVKIKIYVPGCPPRPEAFIYAVLKFLSEK